MYREYFKRFFDIFVSGVALVIFAPILLCIAYLVMKKLGVPILFTQVRPGKDCKLFKMYKFRSMTGQRNSNGELLPDIKRLTSFGEKLRTTSIDELPELINIFKGDMSIVGPRPLAVQYLPYYTEEEMHRHDIRPGLTGLAQVNGRNTVKWEERFSYDLQYIREMSFIYDISIIFKTIKMAFIGVGVTVRASDGSSDFDVYRQRQGEMKNEYLGRKNNFESDGN